jgi:NAD(P)H dehydrogenase (quinone)
MYVVTGITGKVGGALARTLLAAGQPVRAVVRDATKGEVWASRGCEVVLAEMEDARALAEAFSGAAAVFILPPPEFDPEPGYPEAQAVIDSVVEALTVAKPAKVVCLSTIGADAVHDNLLSQRTMLESALRALPLQLLILRPAWFIDNVALDVASARETGLFTASFSPQTRRFLWLPRRTSGGWRPSSSRQTGRACAWSSSRAPVASRRTISPTRSRPPWESPCVQCRRPAIHGMGCSARRA